VTRSTSHLCSAKIRNRSLEQRLSGGCAARERWHPQNSSCRVRLERFDGTDRIGAHGGFVARTASRLPRHRWVQTVRDQFGSAESRSSNKPVMSPSRPRFACGDQLWCVLQRRLSGEAESARTRRHPQAAKKPVASIKATLRSRSISQSSSRRGRRLEMDGALCFRRTPTAFSRSVHTGERRHPAPLCAMCARVKRCRQRDAAQGIDPQLSAAAARYRSVSNSRLLNSRVVARAAALSVGCVDRRTEHAAVVTFADHSRGLAS